MTVRGLSEAVSMLGPGNLKPGHYVYDCNDDSLIGPWSEAQAHKEARRLVDLAIAEPWELTIICISDVTVLSETLPGDGR